jgi:hypothetical protein
LEPIPCPSERETIQPISLWKSSRNALDYWRILLAAKSEKRLLLYAEMKLPGEAWLEFKIEEKNILMQTAIFRLLGVLGRL